MEGEGPQASLDGLSQIKSKYFDAVFIRPGVDFSQYRQLLVEPSELAFKTPDRTQLQFPLSKEQKERFHALLDESFANELRQSSSLTLTDSAGAQVLQLHLRVQDIIASVPQRSVGGIGGDIFLLALGEATMVIELRDAETAEILARVFDRRAVEGTAIAQKQGAPVTRWDDIVTVCEHWAETARARLDAVVGSRY